jgi:hypothetical protein
VVKKTHSKGVSSGGGRGGEALWSCWHNYIFIIYFLYLLYTVKKLLEDGNICCGQNEVIFLFWQVEWFVCNKVWICVTVIEDPFCNLAQDEDHLKINGWLWLFYSMYDISGVDNICSQICEFGWRLLQHILPLEPQFIKTSARSQLR